ncbi:MULTISPECIES: endonuclease domain-containing protein [unclassified Sphingomonas]|uniref:endonuclease domain-containing protein n=1 Tax=unclassified Sphingomonas TaxID=196159 RepID=UPI00258473D2|nr:MULTISPECIES: endonuclease domain-containing protein [unclassified Sphingomonas]
MTLPEIVLWRALRGRPADLKFRKQHPAGVYVLDFFCAAARLCIEVDGAAHDHGDQPGFDKDRDAWLLLHGIATMRVTAADILRDLDAVVSQIVAAARARLPLRQPCGLPPPRAGEE